MMLRQLCVCTLGLLTFSVTADTVVLTSGREFTNCKILQSDKDHVMFSMGYGTVTMPKSQIRLVKELPVDDATWPPSRDAESSDKARTRIPTGVDAIAKLAKQKWARGLEQIPATVIDKGVLASVPYTSYRCGRDYEFNVYGDPDDPAGIEIGIYRDLLTESQTKLNCVEFMALMMSDRTDAGIVKALNPAKDIIKRDGVTFEITPPEADDAYGGWWVSIYNEDKLDTARASAEELKAITVARDEPESSTANDPVTDWNTDEVTKSRPPASTASSRGGYVYVRGYYREDGTYVKGYSRRR